MVTTVTREKRWSIGRSRTTPFLLSGVNVPFFVKTKDAVIDKLFQGNPALRALIAFRKRLFDDLLLG